MSDGTAAAAPPAAVPDTASLLRSRAYLQALVLAAIVGVPISALSYGFLALTSRLQTWIFDELPVELGFTSPPLWWPLLPLPIAGLLVALTITRLPGNAGHSPAEGFKTGGPPLPAELPGIILAALATLALGVVLGPEAPLIAIGGGLGYLAVRLAKRDAPPMAATVIATAGSFAAVSTLLGSPLLGAFLLMEVAGIAGPMLGLVLLPGLLAAGIGTLIFVGLDAWTGLGTYSLALPDVPDFTTPTVAMFCWALVLGLACSLLGWTIRAIGLALRPVVHRSRLIVTTLLGLLIGGLAVVFASITDRDPSEVLFSGQDALPGLVGQAATWSTASLVVLIVCKSLAYGLSLSAFRGGPVFPAMFIGAALGIAVGSLPGLGLVPGLAIGIGAMSTAMLRLPLTSTLLATLLLADDGLAVTPLVIVAVVVTYVVTARLPEPDQVVLPRRLRPARPSTASAGVAG
ncbi:MAG: chloride channel protein [Actinomycetota bacterium]|nr:MAG: chloride channel protein [Actinomycetota bacterium]